MSYERFTKAQLKELCEQRGINIIGLKYKAEIIDAIKQDDMRSDEATGSERGMEVESESVNEYDSDGGKPAESVEDNDRPDDRVLEDTRVWEWIFVMLRHFCLRCGRLMIF